MTLSASSPGDEGQAGGLRRGEPDYRRASLAMLAAGLAIFATLYATQALLPVLTEDLGISPTTAALTVSAATGALAFCVVPASILSERFGRGPILIISALAATVLGLVLPFAPDAGWLIALRLLQGIAVAGVPAVAMTWLAEELHQNDLGRAMGLYIAGTTVGGLLGRLVPAGLLEITDWRVALFVTSAAALAGAIAMTVLLPRQRRFTPKKITPRAEFTALVGHWRNLNLAGLFVIAFVGMGVFVSVYNFIGFRMIDAFGLSPGLVGLIFVLYLSGTWSSARAGALSEQFGRGTVMLTGATLMFVGVWAIAAPWLWLTLVGLLVFTASFFAMHSTASSWIGVVARHDRAEASSMYLMCYYLGSSIIGGAAGIVFTGLPWAGFIAVAALVLLSVVIIAAVLNRSVQRG